MMTPTILTPLKSALSLVLVLLLSLTVSAQNLASKAPKPAVAPTDEPVPRESNISMIKFKVTKPSNGKPYTGNVLLKLYNDRDYKNYTVKCDDMGYIEFPLTHTYTDLKLNFYFISPNEIKTHSYVHLNALEENPAASLYNIDPTTVGVLVNVQLEKPEEVNYKNMHGSLKNINWVNKRSRF